MRMLHGLGLAALLVAACTSAPSERAGCIAGASVACACSNGAMGAQVCQADGTLAACRCDGAPDAGSPDAPDAPVAPDVTLDAAPDVTTPDVTTPDVATPDVTTPDVTTPDVTPDVVASCGALTRCGADCVDVGTDPAHCGSCARVCASGESCRGGACEAPADCRITRCPAGNYCNLGDGTCRPGCALDTECATASRCDAATHACVCNAGYHRCGSACAADSATASCGASCTPCPAVAGGAATCVAGACGTACEAGRILCGGACLACSDPNGVASCAAGACRVVCNAGYHLCGDRCYRDDDASHCGAACAACPTPSAATNIRATCQAGVCEVACAAGSMVCDGVCQAVTACAAVRTRTTLERAMGMLPGPLDIDARLAGSPHLAYRAPGSTTLFESIHYYAGGSVQVAGTGGPLGARLTLRAASPRGVIFSIRGAGPFNAGFYELGAGGWGFNQFEGAVGLNVLGALAVGRDGDRAAFNAGSCSEPSDVYYAERVAGAWSARRVGTGGCVAAVAVAPDGSPRIALWEATPSTGRSLMIMARGAGGTWSTSTAYPPTADASVAAGPTGLFSIVVRSAAGYGYAAEANRWALEPAATVSNRIFTALDVDANNVARFAYVTGYGFGSGSTSGINFQPHLCTRMGGRWVDESLPTIVYYDSHYGVVALSTNSAGRPVVAYQIAGEVGVYP